MRKHSVACAAARVGVLAAIIIFPATRVLAAECRVEPGRSTPAGHHWHYRLDHANGRKCWYLKTVGAAAEKKFSPRLSHADDKSTSSERDREALFEEFLRWQKHQESRR